VAKLAEVWKKLAFDIDVPTLKKLAFDAQTGSFTAGNTLYQTVDGVTASATIVFVDDDGTTGNLFLDSISGTFTNDEIIYESAVGSELVTNGDCELDANWTNCATPTLNERSNEQAHGGTYSRKFTGDAAYDGIQNNTAAVTGDSFYISTFWLYGDGTNEVSGSIYHGGDYANFLGMGNTEDYIPPASWTQHTVRWQAKTGATSCSLFVRLDAGETTGTHYVDDYSTKQITNAALANGVLQAAKFSEICILTEAERTKLAGIATGAIANVVEDTTPQLGGDLEYNEHNQVFKTTLTSDNTASGDIITVTFGESVVFGKLCYPDGTANEWMLALATNAAVKHPAMGVALETKANGETGKLLLRGLIRDATYFSGFALGDLLWLSDGTAGSWVNAAPSTSGDIVQIVGWVLAANYAYFNPDYTYVEVA